MSPGRMPCVMGKSTTGASVPRAGSMQATAQLEVPRSMPITRSLMSVVAKSWREVPFRCGFANLSSVAVLAENMDPILLKATSLFQNVRIRTLYRGADAGGGLKVQGIHAKLMIADRSEVLIGSFNFRFSHINYNVDLGLLAKGRIADHYATIYDSIWGSGK